MTGDDWDSETSSGSPDGPEQKEEEERRAALRRYQREYARRRLAEDPKFRERKNQTNQAYYRRRWENDPKFRERKRQANRLAQERRQAAASLCPRLGRRRGATDIDKHIGERLRARRRSLGISATAMAEVLGVKPRQVSLYEQGITAITVGDLYQLAQYLEVPIEWFFAELPGGSVGTESMCEDVDGVAALFEYIPDAVTRSRLLNLIQRLSATE